MTGENKDEDLDDLIIVGIGASAGGLEALETMFDQMPNNGGMAFVIVQHLSPDFKSLMAELMGRHTQMAIHRVEDNMVVEPDSLYLIPPKQDMIIKDGRLLLTERKAKKTPSLPIDLFLNSLAEDCGGNSVSIILSGTGSDGSRGIRKIHEAGGLVIAQSPESAKFDGMPKNAIKSEFTDVIASPEKIPKFLHEYAIHRDRVALQSSAVSNSETAMDRIFRAIQKRYKIDFGQYRPTTIGRRIERRIEMDRSIDNLKQYADLLEQDEVELDQLHNDLLIGVTSFFRDIKPFESLKQNALKKMLNSHPPGEDFRVWVAACATGEEAYSVAILIDECIRELGKKIEVKVFATDINQKAINIATVGVYPDDMLMGISEQRKARYFKEVEDGFQIVPDIRRKVVYARHNLVGDPPFTRLSLVTCRNMLIYLMPKTQQKVISHFHFGLKKGGFLLMGSSESTGELSGEFEAVDSNNRLYTKKRDVRLRSPLFMDSLVQPSTTINHGLARSPATSSRSQENPLLLSRDEILSNLVPPGIVIDNKSRILQVFRNAGKYLRVNDGLLSSNLMDMISQDLRLAISGAIQRCTKRGEPVCYERLQISSGNEDETNQVRLTVTPLPQGDTPNKFVITFEALQNEFKSDVLSQTERLDLDEVSKNHLERIQQELSHNREILNATTEEMETSNEELQATNEELVASNEELQSANEELHSVNEELFTVNGEYQRKIGELTEMTHDFDNLLVSTDIHTLFLDEKLCIRKFTPRMADVLHLVAHDIGRPIAAFVQNINCENLSAKISQVLQTSELWEETIGEEGGTQFLMRVLPYKAGIETSGVVVTLVDISKLASAQAAVRLQRERFERAIKASQDGTWDWPDLQNNEMWWSPACYQLLGYQPDAFPSTQSQWIRLIHPEDREKIEQTSIPNSNKCYVEVHECFEYRMLHSSGQYRWYCHRAIVDHDDDGNAIRMTGTIADIQLRKASQELANEGIRMRDNFLSMLSHELRNPMGAVMNAIANLDDVADASKKLPIQLELAVIGRQTRQMARLLDDLLDVARFGHDKIEFRKEIVDLCSVVDSVIETVDYRLKEKKQSLKTSFCEGPLNVIGDPSRISQAQINLIVNASKFSDVDSEIQFTLARDAKEAVIIVSDQGAGIDPAMLDSVFELFVQSENTLHRTAGGMGVGLSLTQKIVHAHQGTITAQSKGIGQGAKFQIRLPLTTLKHEKPKKLLPLDRTLVCKVLLVEDNQDAREMMAKTFRRRGFEVLGVSDGKAAIVKLPEFEPAVAVVDIGLPGISGYEVAKAIRENPLWDAIMLIALTGYGQEEDKLAIVEAGFDHHLVKPLIFDELHDLIIKHISGLKPKERC